MPTLEQENGVRVALTSSYEDRERRYLSTTNENVVRAPIVYEGEKVVFDPSMMMVNDFHQFTMEGHAVFVVKRPDGALDFYEAS